ncbi:hypothetical protein GCM10009836_26090 [Pseudonocardia ailaonensis]|uniref:AB hydrolase-1 domain-containing protein n=1 Tax=Pseudonocardia ailaonensis TaxID=367279 RepID=A0ABN2N0K0_9PSEU
MYGARPHIVVRQLNEGRRDRPTLVFGPALGLSVRSLWMPVVAVLGDRCTAVGWDLPGHGDSPVADGSFSVDDLVAAVRKGVADLLLADPEGPPVHYVGSALGALVGLRWVAGDDRLDSVVVTSVGSDAGAADWLGRAGEVRRTGMRGVCRVAAEHWFGAAYRASRPDRTHAFLSELDAVDPGSYAWCCEVLASARTYDARPARDVAVTGIWGELDRRTPPRSAGVLGERWPGLVAHAVPGAAHLVPVERPGRVAHIVAAACLSSMDTSPSPA